jgi:hypothetical protein
LTYSDRKFEVHPALIERIENHKKREAIIAQERELAASRMTPTLEDSDIEMASGGNESEDGDYVLVGQSEEVRRLKQQQRQLRSQLESSGKAPNPVPEPKQVIAKGPEALRPHYTVS